MDPDLSQDQRNQVVQRVEELVGQMDGFLVFTEDWGERKLAYDIKKRSRGYYVRFDYCGLSPLVNEIERFFRIDDRALKYMTVLLDKTVDLAKIKEEQAEAAAKAAREKESQEVSQEESAAAPQDAAPAEDIAPVEDAEPDAEAAPAEDAAADEDADKADDAAPAEASAPAERKVPEDVAPSSDEINSATETTPVKNPEEA
jgi:small subunit ribosomal protein S6